MTENRELTVKRAMTRLDTIKGQLQSISQKIAKYGAGMDKEKFDLVDTRTAKQKNQEEARKEVASLYQKFDDLVEEFRKIKTAINRSNLYTTISVGDKVMTVDEALTYQRHLQHYVQNMVSAYNKSVSRAEAKVGDYNARMSMGDLSANEREALMANVIYLVPPELIKEKENFLIEFMEEVDGALDESNAITKVVIED